MGQRHGDVVNGLLEPDLVLIGETDKDSGDRLENLYHRYNTNKPHIARMSTISAELTKISVNSFITMKISFTNQLRMIASRFENADSRFSWMHPRGRAWREMVKQAVTVLNYKGSRITPKNIKDQLGSKWAWKMARLFELIHFEVDHCSDNGLREAIAEHNFKVQARSRSEGSPVQNITIDNLRVSPKWKNRTEAMELEKEFDTPVYRGLKLLAEHERKKAENRRLLEEVAAEIRSQGGSL